MLLQHLDNLLTTLLAIAFGGGVLAALFGWGLVVQRCAGRCRPNAAITITLGSAALIFWGGLLNLAHVATGGLFDGLLLLGAALALMLNPRRERRPRSRDDWTYLMIVGVFIGVIMMFVILTQFPPQLFNVHDDFEKYFAHPVRMLQTGTLFGSPLSAIGAQTLGGQAVLHGLVIHHFPIPYINGVDAVMGLLICLLLCVSMVPTGVKYIPLALLSVLLVFAVNPYYANISSFYTACAAMMAALLLTCSLQEQKNPAFPPPIMLGLLYAALIALKSSFILFPPLHLFFHTLAHGILKSDRRLLLRWALATSIFTLGFLSPWILLHLPHYLQARFTSSEPLVFSHHFLLKMFSADGLSYGDTYLHYSVLCFAAMIPGGIVFVRTINRRTGLRPAEIGVVSGAATTVFSYILIIGTAPMLNADDQLRYAIPYLVAGTPILLLLAYRLIDQDEPSAYRKPRLAVLLLTSVVIVAGFSSSLAVRIRQGCRYGSTLAFLELNDKTAYMAYNREVLSETTRSRVREAQRRIPPGQAVVAWIGAPFYLDYRRNFVYDAEPGGLANPWAYLPAANYFMLEYNGYAVRPLSSYGEELRRESKQRRRVAKASLAFLHFIGKLQRTADEIYNDGRIVILKLK